MAVPRRVCHSGLSQLRQRSLSRCDHVVQLKPAYPVRVGNLKVLFTYTFYLGPRSSIGGLFLWHRSLIPGILVKPFARPFPSVRLMSPVGSWFSPRSADTAA